jgi:hypothetical protein
LACQLWIGSDVIIFLLFEAITMSEDTTAKIDKKKKFRKRKREETEEDHEEEAELIKYEFKFNNLNI